MAHAAVIGENPEIIFKCLLQLCDTDHDAQLTKTKFTQLLALLLKSANKTENKDMNKINELINRVFGTMDKLSENEFREAVRKDETAKIIDLGLQFMVSSRFPSGPQLTNDGTE